MLLSRRAILSILGTGILIDPFDSQWLKTTSYDVKVGEYFFRRHSPSETGDYIFNPYSPAAVRRHWGTPLRAEPARMLKEYRQGSEMWENIDPDDLVIMLGPQEQILGHTQEFIGGTKYAGTDALPSWIPPGSFTKDPISGRCYTTEMRARSSVGRVGIEVCRCAGWGDCGYINRWTMEITSSCPVAIPIVVGTRLAQLIFYEIPPIEDKDLYGYDQLRDHYQVATNMEAIKKAWKPEMLLPSLSKV